MPDHRVLYTSAALRGALTDSGVTASRSDISDRGFTLIEVMVVLVIISVVLSFAVLSIDTSSGELENEARRLAALFDIASEETVMNSREYRVVFDAEGYSFYRFEGGGKWSLLEDGLLRPRKLPKDVTLLLDLEGERVDLTRETKENGADSAIYFLSSGEVTPFDVEMMNSGGDSVQINNRNGVIKIVDENDLDS